MASQKLFDLDLSLLWDDGDRVGLEELGYTDTQMMEWHRSKVDRAKSVKADVEVRMQVEAFELANWQPC